MFEEPPDKEWLYVPLHATACGVSLRLFRERGGTRCAVGFTSAQRLASVLGPCEPFYRLTEHAVRALAAERDVFALVVDPGMVAAPVRAAELEPGASQMLTPAALATEPQAAAAAAAAGVPEPQSAPVPVPATQSAPVPQPSPADSAPARVHARIASVAARMPEATGILMISAVSGAAALLMQMQVL